MKVLQVFNETRIPFGGEPKMVQTTMRLLADNGHQPLLAVKSSSELSRSRVRRMAAFWTGAYNVQACAEMRTLLRREKPEVVHVHSVYPMFSPSVLVAARRENVATVMTVHNFNLTCPTAFHMRNGQTCDQCLGGREHRCVINNCRGNVLESTAYAMRSAVARRFRIFHDCVDFYVTPTPFAAERLAEAGFDAKKMRIVPNPAFAVPAAAPSHEGTCVGYIGRLSVEKGVDVFIAAARHLPEIPFRIAGDGPLRIALQAAAPPNVEFAGFLEKDKLRSFYEGCRIVVVPSVCYEQFSLSAVEAMAMGRPVIASRIGGLPYVVDDGITGRLFPPGQPESLAREVRNLWSSPAVCRAMGEAAGEKVRSSYSEDRYYRNLIGVYEDAVAAAACRPCPRQAPAPLTLESPLQ